MVCRWLVKAAWEVTRVFVGYEVDAGDRGLEVLEFEPTRPPVVVAEDVRFESERHGLFRGRLVGRRGGGNVPSGFSKRKLVRRVQLTGTDNVWAKPIEDDADEVVSTAYAPIFDMYSINFAQ